jgi:hypothetical protein
MKQITTCPGIGDIIWLLMKLVNQTEMIDFRVGDNHPQRSHQLQRLFPNLINSFEYIPDAGYKAIKRNGYKGKWALAQQSIYLEANSHLEAGKRIEKFLPDLKTSFRLEYKSEGRLSPSFEEKKNYIGIYTSAYSNARQWGGWGADEWLTLIGLIKKRRPEYKYVFIGADYDIGISQKVMAMMKKEDYVNIIGQPLPAVIETLKSVVEYFIGFPSGLSIINETLVCNKTIMFYPRHLENLINTWADPERIESGDYKGCLFCEPEKIFNWMVENKKL